MSSLPKGSAADLRDREQVAKASYERAKLEGCDLQQHRARNAWLRARRAADHADAAVLRDMLLLVDRVAGVNKLVKWSPKQRAAAEKWAIAAHLRASDNVVRVPDEPPYVAELPRVGAFGVPKKPYRPPAIRSFKKA